MSVLVVFDIDGTLTDTVSLHRKAFHEVLISFGLPGLGSEIKEYKHHTDSSIFKEIYTSFKTDWDEKVSKKFEEELAQNIKEKFQKGISEISGAKVFLERLRSAKIPFGYATGSFYRPAFLKLKDCGLPLDVPLATASSFYERESIVQSVVEESCKKYSKSFSKTICFGDGIWDSKTARNLGLEFIGITEDPKLHSEWKYQNIHHVFRDYSDGLSILSAVLSFCD
ncbi:HAD family hydrolase [Leptospira saintgironsiae]|uniref:phosphoglycolate phosphatase n=1 Tax=Leptospira saintgironsiae TaxID=2023183 RepID=A0A2M9YAV5_9LEPT|nr:HAD family hydrolase [Leptospira saintgironsiae]PJZ48714.1 haloacid dehalogenase [Leptospira saintgironsiae]